MAEIDNLKIQQELNKLFVDRRAMLQAQTREMQSQLQLSLQLKAVVDGAKAGELVERLNEAQKALEGLAEKAQTANDTAGQALNGISKGAEKSAQSMTKLQAQTKLLAAKYPSLKSVGVAAISGLSQGFTNLLSLGKGLAGAVEGVTSGIFNIGKAIVSIPLNIFKNLVETAANFSGDSSLAEAFEHLRKEFGSFKEDISKNVITGFHEIQKGFTGTGLSAWRVLGPLANQLKYLTEIAEGAGAQMHQFGKEIAENAGLIAGLDKGLGVGKDNLKAYMDLATVKGQSLNKTMLETANYSLQMGEAFGMSQKVLAKDITMMAKDVKNFGSLTQKEMSVAAVFTRKLGLEVKNLLGLIDKFDTFEDAANSAAQLSQAFGGSVDAFKLMQEQDPAKRLDMLRQAMSAAGKSTENMSRQELKLLEQTTGLDAASAKLAFSTKNQGLTYDQVRKQSEKAEKKQLTQAEAMAKLADSIERFIGSGMQLKGSFWDMFVHGFELGIKWSKPFIELMMNLRRALIDTMNAGRQVGQTFVEAFPGVTTLFKSLSKMFEPKRWSSLMGGIVAGFKDFFKNLDVGRLMDKLRESFFNYFDANSAEAKSFLDGSKKFLAALAKILATGVKYVVEQVTKGLKSLTKFIKDPVSYMKELEAGASAQANEWAGIFKPLVELVKDKKLWNDLADTVVKMLEMMWDKVVAFIKGPTFQKLAGKVMPLLLGIVLGPAVTRTALSLSLETFVKGVTGQLGTAAKDVAKGAEKAGKSAGIDPSKGGLFSSILGNPYVAVGAAVAVLATAGVGMRNGLDKFGNRLQKDVSAIGDKTEKTVGAASAGIIQMLSFGSISDEAAYEMGKNISKLANTLFEKLSEVFGKDVVKEIKAQLMMQMSVLLDLGDLFKSIFKGDVGGIIKSVGTLLWDILRLAVNQALNLFVKLPTKILSWLADVFVDAAEGLDSLFTSGGGAEEMLQKVVEGVEKFFTEHDFPDVGGAILKLLEVVFLKLVPAMQKLSSSLMSALGRLMWKGIRYVFGEVFGLNSILDTVENFFSGLTNFVLDKIKFFLDKMKGFREALLPKEVNEKIDKFVASISQKIAPKPKPTATAAATAAAASNAELSDAQKAAQKAAEEEAKKTEGLDGKLQAAKMTLETTKELTAALKKFDVQKSVDEISMSLSKIDFSKLDTKMVSGFEALSKSINDFITGLESAVTVSEKKVTSVLTVTRDIIKSVQDLNNVLASGDATKIKLTESLKKFADNSGLGKSGSYKIENKGITMHVHFEVKLNAADMEEALVLRHDSLIKDGIKGTLTEEENTKLTPYLR